MIDDILDIFKKWGFIIPILMCVAAIAAIIMNIVGFNASLDEHNKKLANVQQEFKTLQSEAKPKDNSKDVTTYSALRSGEKVALMQTDESFSSEEKPSKDLAAYFKDSVDLWKTYDDDQNPVQATWEFVSGYEYSQPNIPVMWVASSGSQIMAYVTADYDANTDKFSGSSFHAISDYRDR